MITNLLIIACKHSVMIDKGILLILLIIACKHSVILQKRMEQTTHKEYFHQYNLKMTTD
jgi:hypothetical protein